jgi:hypothetical protein
MRDIVPGTLKGFRTSRDELRAAKPRFARRASQPFPGMTAALAMLLALGGGCEGSGPTTDAASDGASEGADRPVVMDAGGSDEMIESDSRQAPGGASLPAGLAPPRRLLDDQATLTGHSTSSCSHDRSQSGPRWCAFSRPGTAGQTELWVINVSEVLARPPAGNALACSEDGPACRRLTANLWVGGGLNGPLHPYAHRFHGDTLIYYADAVSGPRDVHRGPAFAWRPGWAQPRRIGSDRAIECWGHDQALVAYCLEDVAGNPNHPTSAELRAGPIGDRDGIELPSLGRISPYREDGVPAWQGSFSPAGDRFVFSSADPDPTVETLKVIDTAQLGLSAPAEVARDAGLWQLSHDGQRVFFLRADAPGSEVNDLYLADFPTGGNPVKLGARADLVSVLGGEGRDQGVAFAVSPQPGQLSYQLLPDPRQPAGALTVFTLQGQLDAVRISPDARFTAWTDGQFRVRVVQHAGLASCLLNQDPRQPAYSAAFLDGAGLIAWAESDGGDRDRRDGYYADPAGCQGKQRFAKAVFFIAPVGNRGFVFADETDDVSQRATLKYVAITGGKTWPAQGPVRVFPDIDGSSVVPVGWDPLLLLFRVSIGPPDQQGLYAFGPLPF